MMTIRRARRLLTTATTTYSVAKRLYSPVEVSTLLNASREDVYAVLADPHTYPDWLAGAREIRSVDPEFPAPGSAFHHEVGPTDDVTIADSTVVVSTSEPEHLTLEAHAGPFRARVDFGLRPVGSQTEVTMRERPLGAWWLASPALRVGLYLRNRGSLSRLGLLVGRNRRTRAGDLATAQVVGPGGIEPPTEEL